MFVVRSVQCVAFVLTTQFIGWLVMRIIPEVVVINSTALFGVIRTPLGIAAIILLGLVAIGWLGTARLNHWQSLGLVLVLAGGVSNVIDRLVWGGAVDYIPLGSWSTFNLADVEIVGGALLLVSGDAMCAIKKRSLV